MTILIVMPTTPLSSVAANTSPAKSLSVPPKNSVSIRKGPHKLVPVNTVLSFTKSPTDLEITTARVFSEPLIPMTSALVAGENNALASAIVAFKGKQKGDDISDFIKFLAAFPKSRWRASVELNIGKNRFENGYLTQALSLWKSSWELSKQETGRLQRDVADAAISEVLLLDARVGRMDDLEKYFAEIEKRPIFGSNEERVKSAREGLKRMVEKPSEAFKCGPFAVDSILYRNEKAAKRSDVVEKARSTKNGTSLSQVSDIAAQVGLKMQLAKRSPGARFVAPSIIHWKLSHFAAITHERNGLYQVKDPTFGSAGATWLTAKALDAETDGYSLVPVGPLPAGWSPLSREDAAKVWGKGGAGGFNGNMCRLALGPASPPPPGPYGVGKTPADILNEQRGQEDDDSDGCKMVDCGSGPEAINWKNGECPPACENECGMAAAGDRKMECTLNISDTPLRYTPPIGPPIGFNLNYAWLETNQPSSYNFTNWGQNWTSRFVSYLTVAPSNNVITLRRPSGGSEVYTPDPVTGLYPPDFIHHDQMENLGSGVYRTTSTDGWSATYSQADTSSPPRIFMTEWKDPAGNSALIQYDSNFRITTVTDALSQVSTFSYVSNTLGNSGFYKVSTITDPFSRTTQFSYDSTNTHLLSITDAIGMRSEFIYDSTSSFISAMTTPYGTTYFQNYTPANSTTYTARGLKTVYPDGTSTATEAWIPHINKTFHWDRNATKLYPNDPANHDYSHCKTTKWCYDAGTNLLEPVLNYIQSPLEVPQYYQYPGQSAADFTGSSNRPVNVYRSLGNQVILATIGGTKTTGDTVTITVFDPLLIWSGEIVTYTVQSGDTLKTITSGLAAAINANSNLKALGVRATSTQTTIGITSKSPNTTTYTKSTSGGATETLTLSPASNQLSQVTVSGSASAGDSVGLWFRISGGWTYVS